jgi:hypothetical protein
MSKARAARAKKIKDGVWTSYLVKDGKPKG